MTREQAVMLEAAAYLRQSCATCQHSDEDSSPKEGWTVCAAPLTTEMRDPRFPFRYTWLPLDERCKGWTPREP